MPTIKLGLYRHYKNKEYEVLGLAQHTETKERMVLYRPLYECPDLKDDYGDDPRFVRPLDMFLETVEVDGSKVPRFKYLGSMT